MNRNDTPEPIAIIGLGGIFPDSPDIPTYWRNILGKADCIGEVPADRWDWRLYYSADHSAPDKTYSKIGGFVRGFKFDPLPLRIPPPVARQMDTVQQFAVAATAEALRDSGYDKKPFDSSRTAVIFGNAMGGPKKEETDLRVYAASVRRRVLDSKSLAHLDADARAAVADEIESSIKAGLSTITEDTMPGELSNVIAGRVANTFNLNGPNFTVDAACAASLAAVAQAVNGLRLGQFDMAVTGGIDQMMAPPAFVKFSKIGALSADGSRPFDAGANGFVMGEGAGVLVLKRVSDALRDGDRIYALIRAIGASSDGRGKGITAPNPKGQRLAIERTFAQLDYRPEDVGLIEAHGTSTKVGDQVELQTAAEFFKGARPGSIGIGSVKSQIGHLKAAAGVAALIKAALAVHEKTLPPSIHFKDPNPGVDWANCPFFVVTEPRPWDAAGKPRRANVSSFGFGGTNFHLALEEATPQTVSWTASAAASSAAPVPSIAPAGGVRIDPSLLSTGTLPNALGGEAFFTGGASKSAVLDALRELRARVPSEGPLTRLAGEWNAARRSGEFVVSIAAESPEKLVEKIDLVLNAKADVWEKTPPVFRPKAIHPERRPAKRPKIGFMFPGQGLQYVDMLRDMAAKYQVVADTFAEADRIMAERTGPLTEILWTKEGDTPAQVEAKTNRIKQTEITQPVVLTADIALLRLLRQYGVEADIVYGHSLGEYAAHVAAGVMEFKDALFAVSMRAKEMAHLHVDDNGKMASVSWPEEKIAPVIRDIPGYIIAANKNCPIQTVLSGDSAAIDEAIRRLTALGAQAQAIEVSHAFHSKIVYPARGPYGVFLDKVDIRAPRIPILSNLTADFFPNDVAEIKRMMVEHMTSPVEFIRQTKRMYDEGVRVFVELGPKRALTAFVQTTLEDKPDAHVFASNHPKRGGVQEFNDLLARLESVGVELKIDGTVPSSPRSLYTAAYKAWAAGTPCSSPAALAAGPAHGAGLSAAGAVSTAAQDEKWGFYTGPVVVSGVAAGTPGQWERVFREDGIDSLLRGQNLISRLPESEAERQIDKNILRLIKSDDGNHRLERIQSAAEVVRLAGIAGEFDLAKEFGFKDALVHAMDGASRLAVAAGVLALRDAGIPLVRTYKKTSLGTLLPSGWALPEPLRAGTGVIFASAYTNLDAMASEVARYLADKYRGKPLRELSELFDALVEKVSDPSEKDALRRWQTESLRPYYEKHGSAAPYEFSRDFLLRVMPLAHSQLMQWIGARGPGMHLNAACASTTEAVGVAEDWLRLGRAERVLIIAGDDPSGTDLREWMLSGFVAAGAATTTAVVSEAALPFDRRRHGMIVGMGAAGMLLERGALAAERGMRPLVEILSTQYENSAFHATRLEPNHVADVMGRLVAKAEKRFGVDRRAIAAKALFMSHETYTPARGGSASAEVAALQRTFGPDATKIVVTNTKGFHGHSMGASVEDPTAIRALVTGVVPPIANYKEADPDLAGINLSRGGDYDLEYAIRLAAGFGSQIAMTLSRRVLRKGEARIADPARHKAWLKAMSGQDVPELEVVQNTLRIKEAGIPSSGGIPAGSRPAAPAVEVPVKRPVVVQAPTPQPVAQSAPLSSPARIAAANDEAGIRAAILAIVSEKTGYPAEMLEPDLDMEADLGIDTVKQAELIGVIREKYGIPRKENLSLKDYPTLNHVVRFVMAGISSSGEIPAGSKQGSMTPVEQPATPAASAPVAPPSAQPTILSSRAAIAAGSEQEILAAIVAVVSEKTGYPAEMLEADLDMEADLGIDTVKQAELIGVIREKYGIPRKENLSLKDYPTLRHVARFVRAGISSSGEIPAGSKQASAGDTGQLQTPAASAPDAQPSAQPLPLSSPATTAVDGEQNVVKAVVALVSDKTGYPVEMLELNLDMEADLGIDTVKQAELFGLIREKYGIPRKENLSLKDYPTLSHVVRFVVESAGIPSSGEIPAGSRQASAGGAEQPTTPSTEAAPGTTAREEDVLRAVVTLVSEKTGYPLEMLELNLDMEADLGIDTVKQAELFGLIREKYGIPRNETLSLKDYPTLRHVVQFVLSGIAQQGGLKPAAPAAGLSAAGTAREEDVLRAPADIDPAPAPAPHEHPHGGGHHHHHHHEHPAIPAPTVRPPQTQKERDSSVAVAEQRPPSPAPAGAPSEEAIRAAVVALVSEKTGYPAEMLELDLDMEADLGIDTVKQAELIGVIREKYGIPRKENLSLKDYPTLRHVVRFVTESSAPAAAPAPAVQTPAASPSAAETAREENDPRAAALVSDLDEDPYRDAKFAPWRVNAFPKPAKGTPPTLDKERAVVVLVLEPKTAEPFAAALEAAGGAPVVVKTADWADAAEATAELRKALKDRKAGAILDLTALELPAGFDEMPPSAFDKTYRRTARALFLTAQNLREDLLEAGAKAWILVLTRMGGAHGVKAEKGFQPMAGAMTGLAKALCREFDKAKVCAVDFDEKAQPADMLALALGEVGSEDPRREVGYKDGVRHALRLFRVGRREPTTRRVTQRSVFLITGGGGALAAELAKDIARRWKPRIALVDLFPLPKEATVWARMSEEELKEMKAKMWADMKADKTRRATPAMLEREFRRVLNTIKLHHGIEELIRMGCKVSYHAADLTDPAETARAVKGAIKDFGQVDYVFHTAGLEESKLIADKKVENYDRVVRPKAHGAFNLMKALPHSPGQRWVFFSSIVARFGNLGQADYATANDFLVKLAAHMNATGRSAVAFDLTAFADVGMATRGGVQQFLESMGVDFMPPKIGLGLLLDEFALGRETEVVLSGSLGKLDADGIMVQGPLPPEAFLTPALEAVAPKVQKAKVDEKPVHLFDRVLAEGPGHVRMTKTFSLEGDPWLHDHSISGVPYVPGVMGIELFAESVARMTGAPPKALADVRFALPIKLLRGKPATVRVDAKREGRESALAIESDFFNAAGVKLGAPRSHFQARISTAGGDGWKGLKKPAVPAGKELVAGKETIYTLNFHGPSFQVLAGMYELGEKQLLALYRRPEKALWEKDARKFVWNPLLIEAAFQTCGFRDLHFTKKLTLPDTVGLVQLFDHGAPPEELYVHAVYRGEEGDKRIYDAVVFDAQHRVWVRLADYRMIAQA